MTNEMDQCINKDVSLLELYHQRRTIQRDLKLGKMMNLAGAHITDLKPLKESLKNIESQIKTVEDIGFNGGGIIRLM
jgi:hypothetical protein